MPILKQSLSILAGGVKAFLSLEAGVVRNASALRIGQSGETANGRNLEIEHLRGLVAARDRELAELRARGAGAAGAWTPVG